MSCYHKSHNTDLLNQLLDEGKVLVNPQAGRVFGPDGSSFRIEENFGGYLRFRVNISTRERPWFFVHKAVVLAVHGEIPEKMQIDHINRDNQDNRSENLRIVTHRENADNRVFNFASYGEPAF